MPSWLDFWNGAHRLFVNDRHRDVHYRNIAEDIRALISNPDAVVLDYGPGEALHAAHIAAACRLLILCEAAAEMRQRLADRYRKGGIRVCAPADLPALRENSVDLIVANSVVQYLTPPELDELLAHARRLLSAEGRLVIADVIPPEAGMVSDAAAVLAFAWREGFLGAALVGLFATLFSPYRRMRNELGLARFSEGDMVGRLDRAGFSATRRRPNIGHNQRRMAFIASARPS